MGFVNRPTKSLRTPSTEAAYVLTELQAILVRLVGDSPASAAAENPEVFFVFMFKKCLNSAALDADREAEDFFRQTNDSEVDLLDMLWVAVHYCAEAIRRHQEKRENEAWSLVNSGFYWLGLLKAQHSENLNTRNFFDRQKSSGRKGAETKWGPRNETRNYVLKLFEENSGKSNRDFVKKVLPKVLEKAKEVGVHYSEGNIERTIKDWLSSKTSV